MQWRSVYGKLASNEVGCPRYTRSKQLKLGILTDLDQAYDHETDEGK